MEFANLSSQRDERNLSAGNAANFTPIQAQTIDRETLETFVNEAFFRHVHADWYDPLFWLDEPHAASLVTLRDGVVCGCLITAADPPPAAWIRTAAFEYNGLSRRQIQEQFLALVEESGRLLAAQGVSEICWMSPRRWAEPWLVDAGFQLHTTMVTYRKEDTLVPPLPHMPPELVIRPVLPEDMRLLAEIEVETYAPLWRHSQRGLQKAWRGALSFDVALWEGVVIGFQHSTRASRQDAHLARITILPTYQGLGIGSQLLGHAVRHYKKEGIKHITLNTQAENAAAQRLYRRFGFLPTPYRWPLSTLTLTE